MNTTTTKRESMTATQAYRMNRYIAPVPPVNSSMWRESDWINYINRCGRWTVDIVEHHQRRW